MYTSAALRFLSVSHHLARPTVRIFSLSPQRRSSPRIQISILRHNMSQPSVPADPSATPTTKTGGAEDAPQPTQWDFPVSPVPENPLGEGKYIKTAAALVIGDEILNGKTLDRNSNYFAKFCFENGIDLKRIEVIPDDEDDIVEASRRLVKTYDFVITSGGIGPTHDDITYASLAKAFNQPLTHHAETLARMTAMSRHRADIMNQTAEQREARERMALFPAHAEALFIAPDVWVPVVRLEGKLCVFPGIPKLFQRMLDGLRPYLPLPPPSERPFRLQVFTSLPESSIAPYLTQLQARTKAAGVRVGSYPLLMRGVYVALIGRDEEAVRTLATEVAEKLEGRVVSEEEAVKEKAGL